MNDGKRIVFRFYSGSITFFYEFNKISQTKEYVQEILTKPVHDESKLQSRQSCVKARRIYGVSHAKSGKYTAIYRAQALLSVALAELK